ncbi:MAG: reverse transcriptase family protein [Hyphomicrobiaceae bacterium]
MRTSRHHTIARNIAVALLAGVWSQRSMTGRLEILLGKTTRKAQKSLLAEITAKCTDSYPPATSELAAIVLSAAAFERAARPLLRSKAPIPYDLRPARQSSPLLATSPDLPRLATAGDIAGWLGLSIAQLNWFADEHQTQSRTTIPILQHYTYRFRKKGFGPPRLIEAPKPRLKTIQRTLLRDILDCIPAHDAAHGFVAGRSCETGAAPHAGAAVVVGLDIQNFFPTTPLGRVQALFRSLGYPHDVARILTRLCSTTTPTAVFNRLQRPARHTRDALVAYRFPHLPQGAPTSPALANLVAWRLDQRLSGLARSFGATYTRYADDMTFSGDAQFGLKAKALITAVATIAEDEGYALNDRKSRVMTSARRQQVTGLVVNAHLNVARDGYDRLKAILHNCRRNGLEAENRADHPDFRAHLEGRVGWVESINPARGRRLRAILQAIP